MNYYPPVGYFFTVTFINSGGFGSNLAQNAFDCNFKEVGGLTSEVQVEYSFEGGVNDMQHPLPKAGAKFGNITLKRGLLVKSELANWMYDAVENFNIVPKELVITLLGPLAVPLAAWHVTGAFPIKWEISGFNAMDNAIVIESIEMACQKHRRIIFDTFV